MPVPAWHGHFRRRGKSDLGDKFHFHQHVLGQGLDCHAGTGGLLSEVTAIDLVKGDKVQLIGFGTFETRERAAKEGRNPRTGETIKIAATKVPAFKAGKALKDAVAK